MRRAFVLLLALAALAAGCGGATESGPFATGDAPLDVELGPERTVEQGVVVRQVVYRSGEDRVGGYLVAPAAAAEPVPAVLYLHGAGGDREEQLDAAVRLAREGAAGLTTVSYTHLTLPTN